MMDSQIQGESKDCDSSGLENTYEPKVAEKNTCCNQILLVEPITG